MSFAADRLRQPSWLAPSSLLRLLVALVICFAAAAAGSAMTLPFIHGWYATLVKPPFNPPNWVFGPAWTILYTLMAIGLWRVWVRGRGDALRQAGIAFTIQIVLNTLWSGAFFALQLPWLALAIILALLAAIVATIRAFRPIDRIAAWLYAPYIAWVCFATLLNLSIAILN